MRAGSKKYAEQKRDIHLCAVLHNAEFDDPHKLVECLNSGFSAAKLKVDGELLIRGDDFYRTPISSLFAGIVPRVYSNLVYLSHREGRLDMYLTPIELRTNYWADNLKVRVHLNQGVPLSRGIEILRAFAEEMGSFWGEVIDARIVGGPSLCGPNEHSCFVPKIGNANYFGPEYVRYFGGIDRFKSAPSLGVEEVGNGLFTSLDPALSPEQYLNVRSSIQKHLGERLFRPDRETDRSLYLSLFGPEDPSLDPVYFVSFDRRITRR